MSQKLLAVEPGTTLDEAARRMTERGVGSVVVLESERLTGIFTERDLLRAVASGYRGHASVGDWMTRHPETIEPDDTVEQAAVIMIHGGFRHLPVLDGERVVGILSIRDLMGAVLQD